MTDNQPMHLISPRIVKAGQTTTIFIAAQWFTDQHIKPPSAVVVSNVSGMPTQMMANLPDQIALDAVDDGFLMQHYFPNEGEYMLLLETPAGITTVTLYALEADLYDRRPFRGDVHMHSNRSDGKEPPAAVAAACRRIGLDFMALTDHWRYTPSLEAIKAFENVPVDLRIYPGEEVHIPCLPVHQDFRQVRNPIHIVNFGGHFSINDWIQDHESAFDNEVKAVMKRFTELPPGIDKRIYAECVWCFEKIRDAGGLAVFCHPYWINHYRYDVPEALTNLIMEQQPYDALELIGGYRRWEFPANHLQVARYNEARSQGKRIPIVGVSDAHGCNTGELFGWYTTLVFSPSDSFADLKQSIMDLYSVAVESVPGAPALAHGPFRLVKYSQFLIREILPAHNALCYEEGVQMQAYIDGDEEALVKLQSWQGRIAEFYQEIWGENPSNA